MRRVAREGKGWAELSKVSPELNVGGEEGGAGGKRLGAGLAKETC